MEIAILLVVGVVGGFVSAIAGIGGGIVIIPALVLALGYSQKLAQGTTLAMLLPPIGALAVWSYHKKGLVDFRAAMILCAGFVVGSFAGAEWATGIDNELLKKGFGLLLMALGARMLF
jgi:uncharacterized protein